MIQTKRRPVSDSVDGVTRSNEGFETTDVDARIVGHLVRGLDALIEIAQPPLLLERIARCHQPPHTVELQPLDREQADGAMCDVRRIERAAEQADAHAVAIERDGLGDRLRRGRRLVQRGHRECNVRFFDAFSSREPVPTLDRVRGRLSLETASGFTAASARCRGRDI